MAGKIVHIELPSADSEHAKTFWALADELGVPADRGALRVPMFRTRPARAPRGSRPGGEPIVYLGSVDIDSDIAQGPRPRRGAPRR